MEEVPGETVSKGWEEDFSHSKDGPRLAKLRARAEIGAKLGHLEEGRREQLLRVRSDSTRITYARHPGQDPPSPARCIAGGRCQAGEAAPVSSLPREEAADGAVSQVPLRQGRGGPQQESLVEARLTINLAKSEFSASTVMYLGLLVGHGGIRPREKEVADILSHEAPKSKKSLRTSQCLIGVYSPFLPPELCSSCEPPFGPAE